MKSETQNKLQAIKKSFISYMNGVASQSMRDKGLGYKINWGINLPVLKEMAAGYGKDYDLAIALWKEDIRECKILATLIMPADLMQEDLAELWIKDICNQEMAEMAAFNLFQYMDGAKELSLKWLSSASVIEQICGYNTLARLFLKNINLNEREINEFIDQAKTALEDENLSLRHAAKNALVRFGNISDVHLKIVESALKSLDLDIF